MNFYKLLQPNGHHVNVYYKNKQSKLKILTDVFLPRWEEFCLSNWLNKKTNGIGSTAEDRVKKFLDSCAWFLLRSDTSSLISEHKEKVCKEKFVPVSSCSQEISDYFYADGATIGESGSDVAFDFEEDEPSAEQEQSEKDEPKKIYPPTRYEKMAALRNYHAGYKVSFCAVDTNGLFTFNGDKLKVEDKRYAPTKTKDGDYYEMDRIMCVSAGNGIHFYTQSVDPIDPSDIVGSN